MILLMIIETHAMQYLPFPEFGQTPDKAPNFVPTFIPLPDDIQTYQIPVPSPREYRTKEIVEPYEGKCAKVSCPKACVGGRYCTEHQAVIDEWQAQYELNVKLWEEEPEAILPKITCKGRCSTRSPKLEIEYF